MDPTLLLTHAAVAAFAVFTGLAIGRRHVAQQREQAERSERSAAAEIDALRKEADTLRPLVWKVASLEGALAAHEDEVTRIRRDAAEQVDASRRRLAETEWMVVSLQQALVAAQPPGAVPAPGHADDTDPDTRVRALRALDDGDDVPLPDALSIKLEQLRARIGELSQQPRWPQQARER